MSSRTSVASLLGAWAASFTPDDADLDLADRALKDTVAVTIAARDHRLAGLVGDLPDPARWAAIGHVLDFDDLHLPSTAHISVVCVPATLAVGGDARAYLVGAGAMARLGGVLGWEHYTTGWHATCTAGAPAAAAGAAAALGLDADGITTAMALAVPAAGGVQRAFGTDGKALQVGMAAAAGVRAARLAAAGASVDPTAVDQWLTLVGGRPDRLELDGSAVPGGLAVKLFPCCYALQRPIGALRQIAVDPEAITRVVMRTPAASIQPLIHHRPKTGLEGKFSLEYGAATALLDAYPGFDSFTDEAVRRDAAQRLVERVEVQPTAGGEGLLTGELEAEIHTGNGDVKRSRLDFPPGSPQRPPEDAEFLAKLEDCTQGVDVRPETWTWASAADVLRTYAPPHVPGAP